MTLKTSRFHDGRRGAAITVKVIPGSSVNKLAKILDDGTLTINLKVSQKGDEINLALIDYLEGILDVPGGKIEIIAGEVGTEKLIAILDVDPDEIHNRIMKYSRGH